MSIKIFIVDTGVDENHPELKERNITGFGIKSGEICSNYEDDVGHGTAVTSLILRHLGNSKNIEITSVKIFTTNMQADECELISALKYISNNCAPDIINISLGLNYCDDIISLQHICEEITDKGTLIISAFDNAGAISYPAAFSNVIGVTSSLSCHKNDEFEFIDDCVVNIAAKGNIQRVAWTNPNYIMLGGNSFACAHVSAKVAEFMLEGIISKEAILGAFQNISIRQYKFFGKDVKLPHLFKINKAAIFPFNKEMHSLMRFNDILTFDITDVYDSKYSANVGATTSQLMKDSDVKKITIKNIEGIEWDRFDTFIIGHINELASLTNKDNLRRMLIDEALNHHKKIYSFDELNSLGYHKNKNIFYPQIIEEDLPPNRFGMLYRISKPVLGVFGTSSRQGKYTLQLKLRQLLIEQGYDVGQIGTEPSALLYGMDYIFPMGYNSSVHIKEFDIINYLNYIVNDLCMQDKDIIIVGSQSGTVTFDSGNLSQYTLPQFHFLLGTQPDAVILCINPYDDIDYIRRTISFIESSVKCTVIALVVFPMTIRDNWSGFLGAKEPLQQEEFNRLKNTLSGLLHIPVFELGKKNDMAILIQDIINFF